MNRIFELDVIRGLAIFIMILVDSPPAPTYEILIHASWEGLTLADLAFPGFVFAMGMSAAVSSSRKVITWRKIFIRTISLFIIGILLNEIGYFLAYIFIKDFTSADLYNYAVEHLRLFGILQRLALTYFLGMTITKFINTDKGILMAAFMLLIISSAGFHLYAPENPFDETHNISGAVDLIFPNINHIYTPTHDPEGLYGTIATTASMLFGFLAGKIFIDDTPKFFRLIIFGVILLALGGLWSCFDIIAKKIWTTPFALITSGIELILTAILLKIFKLLPYSQKFFQPLAATGRNPLVLFMASNITLIFFYVIGLIEKFAELMHRGFFSVETNVAIFCLIWSTLWLMTGKFLDARGILIKL